MVLGARGVKSTIITTILSRVQGAVAEIECVSYFGIFFHTPQPQNILEPIVL